MTGEAGSGQSTPLPPQVTDSLWGAPMFGVQMGRWVGLGSTWDLPQKQGLERSLGWALSHWQHSNLAVLLCILPGTALGTLTTVDGLALDPEVCPNLSSFPRLGSHSKCMTG